VELVRRFPEFIITNHEATICLLLRMPVAQVSNDKMRGPELRQRRRVVDSGTNATKAGSESTSDTPETQHVSGHISDLAQACNTVTGYLIMLLLSYQFSVYLCQLHDNDLWFSEIMEVEREISSELSKDYIILISNNWCIQRACLLVSKTFNVITRLNQDTPSIFYRDSTFTKKWF